MTKAKIKTNEKKDLIQKNALELSREHRFLCLEWSTGCGKTRAAGLIMQDLIKQNPAAVGYLICKESTHKENWINDLKKHKLQKVLKNTKPILYASLKNQKEKANFVILDECHALTDLRVVHLVNILQKGTRIIFLSATIPLQKMILMNQLCRNTIYYYKIDLMKAFKLNLLPEPRLVVHQIYLKEEIYKGKKWEFEARQPSDKKSGLYVKTSHGGMFEAMKNNDKKWGIICQGTEAEHYSALSKQMEYYYNLSEDHSISHGIRTGCRNKYLNIASARKKFIAEVKTSRVRELVEEFRSQQVRFICFTGSIKQVKELGSHSAVHSKNTNEKNQELIDCFNKEECDELFAVKMLREGINLTNIERGIITQLDSKIGSFFQMLGRCLRHEFPEMHLMLLKDTKDEEYFNKSMEHFDKKYIDWK